VSGQRIGVQLKRARVERGLSLREVAAMVDDGLSHTSLSAIENGTRYPTLRTLEKLVTVLQIRVYIEPSTVLVETL
jgi:transcriptional regulator with XRE-family HTH domain